jgi:hypothetical protein
LRVAALGLDEAQGIGVARAGIDPTLDVEAVRIEVVELGPQREAGIGLPLHERAGEIAELQAFDARALIVGFAPSLIPS